MCTLEDINNALSVLKKYGVKKKQIILLHCSTEYPVPIKNVNINAMINMQKTFNIKVGYSDHSLGTLVPIIAVAKGACIIEKHITLDNKMEGPDHSASIEPIEFTKMVNEIRSAHLILGSHIKTPSPEEKKNIPIVRKYIVAKKNIKKNDLFNLDNIAFKRCGKKGINPMYWKQLVGKKSNIDYMKDELIKMKISFKK